METTSGKAMAPPEKKTCHKIPKVLVDARVIAEFTGDWRLVQARKPAERANVLRLLVRNFKEFLRDHRSQDVIHLEVEEVLQDQCSICGAKWEPDRDENGIAFCASCGTDLEEQK